MPDREVPADKAPLADTGVKLWNDHTTVYPEFSEMWKGKFIFALFDAQGKRIFQHPFTVATGLQQEIVARWQREAVFRVRG